MNKEYIYKNGEAVIVGDKVYNTEYYDNLDKVLIKENLIETIEKDINSLNKKYKNFNLNEKIKKLNYKKWTIFFSLLSIPILSLIMILSIQGIKLGYINLEILNKVFKINNFITTFTYPFVVMGSIVYLFIETIANKVILNNIRGELSQLDYLKKTLEKEKKELNELNKNLVNTKKSKKIERVKVDDKEVLENLYNTLYLYYDLGYNEDKYYNYLIEGTIEEKLNNYTKEELLFIKNYLKENHKVLKKSLTTM